MNSIFSFRNTILFFTVLLLNACDRQKQIESVKNEKKLMVVNEPLLVPSFKLDTALININLDDTTSYKRSFKRLEDHHTLPEDNNHESTYTEFVNFDSTQKMTAYFHKNTPDYYVSEFKVEKGGADKNSHELQMVGHFKTNNGIRLKMTKKEVEQRIGIPISKFNLNGQEVWEYELKGNYVYLKTHNKNKYYARYIFENEKLVVMRFGFAPE